jgi:hypothetical protein
MRPPARKGKRFPASSKATSPSLSIPIASVWRGLFYECDEQGKVVLFDMESGASLTINQATPTGHAPRPLPSAAAYNYARHFSPFVTVSPDLSMVVPAKAVVS